MAVSKYKTFIAGEVLTAADLNASLDQVFDNGQDISFPRTEAADFDGFELILDADADSSITVDTDDRLDIRLRGTDLFRFDGATGGTTVNGLDFIASAAGAAVQLATVGADTDVPLNLVTKGTGALQWDGTAFGTVFSRDTGTGSTNVPLVSDILGLRSVWIPASAMSPATTSGCAPLAQVELTAGRPELVVLDFSGTTDEFAHFSFSFPPAWDLGTVTAQFYYTVSAAVATTVKWDLQAVACADSDTIDVAFGTLQSVTDTFLNATNDQAITSATSAITIAGTPADNDMIWWRVGRDPDNDTTTQDARLIGIKIFYTVDALKDG